MVENQSEKLPLKSIEKHAQRFNKALRAKNKLKKRLIKQSKPEIYGWFQYFLQKKLNRVIINRYQHKKQLAVNNELRKLRLAKLANNEVKVCTKACDK